MDAITEEAGLPTDIDAQPVVRAAAAMRPKLRDYKDQVETEQRLPPGLVEEFRAAGFYSLVMPRSMGGLQADPLTYQRVVELLAEGLGSAGWNVANNGVGQLITLGFPDEGVRGDLRERRRHDPCRHRGAGWRDGGASGRRLSCHRPLELRQRLPGGRLDDRQFRHSGSGSWILARNVRQA